MALEKGVNGLQLFKKRLKSQFKYSSTSRDRTFIIPTPFGLIFGLLVLAILMMALGYANNLLYFLVFYLISVSVSAMITTNRNIDRIRISECHAGKTFALEKSYLHVNLKNKGRQTSELLELKCENESVGPLRLNGFQEKSIDVPWIPKKRGLQKLPMIKMQSRFPFGLLTAWKVKRENTQVLVYPAKKGRSELPNQESASENSGEVGLFRDLREYQMNDSPRRVDWRASTKHQEILVRTYEGPSQKSYLFDWSDTADIVSFEDRISQICLWIVNAEKLGFEYSMRIGGFLSESGHGPKHFTRCLDYLAQMTREGVD